MRVKDRVGRVWSLIGRAVTGRGSYRNEELQLARMSMLFDGDWYLREYPDVQAAGIDPLRHYMSKGWHEGRDPGPEFSSSAYLRANADVARAGCNPLIHFIEFGRSEGREAFGHRPKPQDAPILTFDFPDAAPCFSAAIPKRELPEWARQRDLSEGRSDFRAIGDLAVGYAANADAHAVFQAAARCLVQISGFGDQSSAHGTWRMPDADERLIDAWYATSIQLRTRWESEKYPFVVRAYQADPVENGTVEFVGEGLIASPLDVVDLHLKNPYFPVLIVLAEPEGSIRGARMLAFPSLCRGGVHYSELLYSGHGADQPLDPLVLGERLAGNLGEILSAGVQPAVTGLSVDLHGADGATPLFQRDFRIWLERVAGIDVLPLGEGDGSRSRAYLADEVKVEPSVARRGMRGKLVLQHDMIPTLAILTEPGGNADGRGGEALLPAILLGGEPAQPAISIAFPEDVMEILKAPAGACSRTWPRLDIDGDGLGDRSLPPGAIGLSRINTLTDAELFFPVSRDRAAKRREQRDPITWLIEGRHWHDKDLLGAISAASQQYGADADAIAMVGPVARRITDQAATIFGARIRNFADIGSAIAGVNTALCGYIGPGVILHDNGCVASLSRLLNFDLVATASCVLISVEPRGKTWHAAIADGGGLTGTGGNLLTPRENAHAAEALWRSVYPVAAPSPSFWVAKTTSVRGWKDQGVPSEGLEKLHLCSSLVTASLMTNRPSSPLPSFIPKARPDRVASTQVLFG